MRNTVLRGAISVLSLVIASFGAGTRAIADTPKPSATLAFSCAPDNDLFQALRAGGTEPARYDSAEAAIAGAAEGTAVLILADGYPEKRTTLPDGAAAKAVAKRLRIYIEYPQSFPGVDLKEARGVKWERAVVASKAFGNDLPAFRILAVHDTRFVETVANDPLLVIARVAGYDTAVYGMPPERFPLLFSPTADVLIATTRLSNFVRDRFAPSAEWIKLWQALLNKLDPAAAPHKLVITPTVQPAYAKDAPLPADAERIAASRFAKWLTHANLLIPTAGATDLRKLQADGVEVVGAPSPGTGEGDGSLGILEGYASQIQPGGGQMRRIPIRADCQTESAAVLALHGMLENDSHARTVAKNLLDFTYFTSGMCKGGRGDPTHPAFGLIAWGDIAPAWMVANYGDDNARVLLGTILAAACLKSDAWDESLLRGLLANLRTTGQLGFRGDRIDMPQLEQKGWKAYHDGKPVNLALNFEAYPWACFLWAYHQTGEREFLDKSKSAIGITMQKYPDGWRWGDNMERARMLLPLAWLVRVEDTPEHRAWLKRIVGDLLQNQDACGAIREHLGGAGNGAGHYHVPASNDAYGTSETPLIQTNGDPVSDQLYTAGFALLGLHEAAAATGDPEAKAGEDKLAAYLTRIQVRSDALPYLDGAWFRAFDYGKWDYWASSADVGWGAWSIEAGWCQAWGGITLSLRTKGTSFWDLATNSTVTKRLPAVKALMDTNTGEPWKGSKPR